MFSQRSIRAGLFSVVALVSAALAAPRLSVLFSDDFNDGDDVGWMHFDLIGGTIYDASSGSYTITTVPLPPLPITAGAATFLAESVDNQAYRNITFRVTVRFGNGATNATLIGHSTPGPAPGHFYSFNLNNADPVENFIQIIRVDDDFNAPTELAHASFQLTEGVDYNVVARMTGAKLTMTVWRADGPEPDGPQLVAHDSTYMSQTGCGLAVFNQSSLSGGSGGALSATFDNVVITRGAASQ